MSGGTVALNVKVRGRRYPPTAPYLVTREQIDQFANAVGADDPAHRDPAVARRLGYPTVIAPPTFPVVVTQPAERHAHADPDLRLDPALALHWEQSFAYRRPVFADDRLVVMVHIADVRVSRGTGIVTTRADVHTETGTPVCVVVSTLAVFEPDAPRRTATEPLTG
jgi:acyl dehydratase